MKHARKQQDPKKNLSTHVKRVEKSKSPDQNRANLSLVKKEKERLSAAGGNVKANLKKYLTASLTQFSDVNGL